MCILQRIAIGVVLLWGVAFNTSIWADENRASVLLISAGHSEYPTSLSTIKGIRSVLDSINAQLDVEFMDALRFNTPENLDNFRNSLAYKLDQRTRPYQAVITTGNSALEFVINNHATLFKNTPVVFCGVNDPALAKQAGQHPQITGVMETVSIKDTLEMIQKLHPKCGRVVAIVDELPETQKILEQYRKITASMDSLDSRELSLQTMDFDALYQALENLAPSDVVLLISAAQDKTGQKHSFHESLSRICKHCRRPIYHFWEQGVGQGVFGGKMISQFAQGQAAAGLLGSILNGKSVALLPVMEQSPNIWVFDHAQLKQFDVSEDQLPPNAKLVNRPIPFFNLNQRRVWGVTLGFIILSVLSTALIINIIRRRHMEQQLRESEQLYSLSLETAEAGSWDWDIQTGKLAWSEQVEPIFGFSPGTFPGTQKAFRDKVHPDDMEHTRETIETTIENGADFNIEHRIIRPDDTIRWVSEIGHILRNHQGKPVRIIGMVRDITREKQDEDEKQRLQERLFQSEKLKAIGQLAGGIAHDFNNILAAIQGNAELTQMAPENPDDVKRWAQGTITASKRAASLVRQLLSFARQGKQDTQAVNVHDIIDETLKILNHTIDKRISIQTHFYAEKPTVLGDSVQLQNALLNIGINARDAMPDGGELCFTTRTVKLDREFCQKHDGEIVPGLYIQIDIRDSGVGMSPELQKRIFEPFFTTKDVGQGTGLGLASVFGCVKSHSGLIHVYSASGVGSTFQMFLPYYSQDEEEHSHSTLPGPKDQGQIMVIDDDPKVRDIISETLLSMGYTVIEFQDGQQAIHYLRKNKYSTALIILDLLMPALSGKETFQRLKAVKSDIPILVASGFATAETVAIVMQDGAAGFLSKPIDIQELISEVKRCIPSSHHDESL